MSSLPTSSITSHQSDIMWPEGVYEYFALNDKGTVVDTLPEPQTNKDIVMMVYTGQIWLRIILNEAHNALYGASKFY
jgi:hypothetical protein